MRIRFIYTMKRIFYLFLILAFCIACQDDDSFSSSSSLKLEFSVDTLSLDTVFSRVPSSTMAFVLSRYASVVETSLAIG